MMNGGGYVRNLHLPTVVLVHIFFALTRSDWPCSDLWSSQLLHNNPIMLIFASSLTSDTILLLVRTLIRRVLLFSEAVKNRPRATTLAISALAAALCLLGV